jgi:hypothetical protein
LLSKKQTRDALDELSRQVASLHELELEETHIINLRAEAHMQQKA